MEAEVGIAHGCLSFHSSWPRCCWTDRSGAAFMLEVGRRRLYVLKACSEKFVMRGSLFLRADHQHSAAGFLLYARFDPGHDEEEKKSTNPVINLFTRIKEGCQDCKYLYDIIGHAIITMQPAIT